MSKEQNMSISELVQSQKSYFLGGNTMPLASRRESLKKLKSLLKQNEDKIAEAVYKDYKKSYFEVIENELSLTYVEISLALSKLGRWSKPIRTSPSIINIPANCRVYAQPFGSVLCIAPWNYPVQLALIPVVSALAAGNTVILKPSEISSYTSDLLAEIINSNFPSELIYVQTGGVKETQELLSIKFDKIFFTGSTEVGRIVMQAAAKYLTPVTLELGGKNPVIVMPDCNLKRTAQRLVWGKFHNGGQACVSPDHIYVHEDIQDDLIAEVEKNIEKMFKGKATESESLPRIINEKNYNRLMRLINQEKVILGGKGNREELFIEPTVMTNVTEDDAVMQEEVFGPLMPFLSYKNLDDLLVQLKQKASPLALYLFTKNLRLARKIHKEFRTGGGMINETVVHFVNASTPFGGIGDSGMGSYHGRAGFENFSHRKTVIKKPTWFELWVKYPPYVSYKLKLVRLLLR
jgi:aldehyde dehydrogenase (NAD+)